MVSASSITSATNRYGAVGFIAALANTLVLDFTTWVFLPWLYLAVLMLPILLVDLMISAVVARYGGKVGQAGRGMLIGCLSGPLSLIIFIPALLLVTAVGLV
jgi:hypothetical protein